MNRADIQRLAYRGRGLAAAVLVHAVIAALVLPRSLISPETVSPDPLFIEIVERLPADDSPGSETSAVDGQTGKPDPGREVSEEARIIPPPSIKPERRRHRPAANSPSVTLDLPPTDVTRSPVDGQVRGPQAEPEGRTGSARPLAGQATRRAIRALRCARLSRSQRANCPSEELDDVTLAEMVADTRNAELIYGRYARFASVPTTRELARSRQLQAYAERPFTPGPTSTGDIASAGTVGQLNAYPDPLWDGYRDPSWNDD